MEQLKPEDWTTYTIRQGTKGPLQRVCYSTEVFLWARRRPKDPQVEALRLIISKNLVFLQELNDGYSFLSLILASLAVNLQLTFLFS